MTTSSSGQLIPNSPIVNLGNLYVNGMALTYVGTTSFTVGAGQCRDASDTTDIIMGGNLYSSTSNPGGAQGTNNPVTGSSAVTVTITASGAGGLDAGTIAASTMYNVFAIGDSRNFNSGSALISLSTTPSLPLGYDCYRYVGAVSIDGSSHVRPFKQTGAGLTRTTWYDSGTLDATHIGLAIPSSATAASQTYASIGVLTTLMPAKAIECMIYASLVANAAGDSLFLGPYGATGPYTGFRTNASGTVVGEVMRVPAALHTGVPEIDYATSSATATVAFTFPGYVDQL